MDVEVEMDGPLYVVRAADDICITATFSESDDRDCELVVRNWCREVERIYGKRGRKKLVVSLHGEYNNFSRNDKRIEEPFGMLHLCVGNHCLVYRQYSWGDYTQRALKDFFDRHTFVGIGIERIAKNLEKFHGECLFIDLLYRREADTVRKFRHRYLITKRVDLRELAVKEFEPGKSGGVSVGARKCSLLDLAKEVLGEEVEYRKPANLEFESDQHIMWATFEAFLASQIGAKLLKTKCQNKALLVF